MKIQINFKNFSGLECVIQDTQIGRQYFLLVQQNYQQSFPIYREELNYTPEYFYNLARQAATAFGWGWSEYDIAQVGIGALLHKDLEILLADGFRNIPEQYDNLIHEIHYALHLNQHGMYQGQRTSWFQVEWYNDSGFDLTTDFTLEQNLKVGDVKLQNPFVGHGPLQMWLEQDFINVDQTCKFHNFVRPGINVVHTCPHPPVDQDEIIAAFQTHAPEFVRKHSVEKIQHYIGYPVIGHVEDIDLLLQLKKSANLELHSLEFYE